MPRLNTWLLTLLRTPSRRPNRTSKIEKSIISKPMLVQDDATHLLAPPDVPNSLSQDVDDLIDLYSHVDARRLDTIDEVDAAHVDVDVRLDAAGAGERERAEVMNLGLRCGNQGMLGRCCGAGLALRSTVDGRGRGYERLDGGMV